MPCCHSVFSIVVILKRNLSSMRGGPHTDKKLQFHTTNQITKVLLAEHCFSCPWSFIWEPSLACHDRLVNLISDKSSNCISWTWLAGKFKPAVATLLSDIKCTALKQRKRFIAYVFCNVYPCLYFGASFVPQRCRVTILSCCCSWGCQIIQSTNLVHPLFGTWVFLAISYQYSNLHNSKRTVCAAALLCLEDECRIPLLNVSEPFSCDCWQLKRSGHPFRIWTQNTRLACNCDASSIVFTAVDL